MKNPIILFLLLFTSSFCSATNWYVATTGSNISPSSGGGTVSSPFLTIAYAATWTSPGDIVTVEDGTYTWTDPANHMTVLSISGNSSAYITYRARNIGGAILNGGTHQGMTAFSFYPGTSYINISGFEIKGFWSQGIEVRDGASYINFSDLHIHDIGRYCHTDGSGKTAFTVGTGSNIVIERCLIHTIGAYAPGENGCTYDPAYTGYQTLDHGIYIAGTSYMTIKNNVFYDCKSGFGIQFYSGAGDHSSNVDIINNTFENGNPWQNGGHIVLCNSLTTILIANNIFKDQHTYAIDVLNYGYTYSGVTVTKNIVSGGNGQLITGDLTNVTVVNNYNSTDPLFVNEATHNYALQSISPAINSGYSTGLTTDYLNNPRTNVDIGAYEYMSGGYIYYNVQASGTAIKNDCPSGYRGTSVTYTVLAGLYGSNVSQQAADNLAVADIAANSQVYANAVGSCTVSVNHGYLMRKGKGIVKDGKLLHQ
jgi:hypothetical protein